MPTEKPPRYLLDRRTIGNMEVSLDVLDGLTIGGVSTAGVTVASSHPNIALLAIIGTVTLQLLKLGLRSIIAKSVAVNPINTTENVTVTLPEPIAPDTDPKTPS